MNYNKKKYNWLLLLLAGICCFACTAEREPADDYKPAGTRSEVPMSVHLGVQGVAVDPEQINTAEAAIRRLRLYVFDGNVLDKMYYWDNINCMEAYTTPTFMVKAGTGKSVYVIVNEPEDTATRAQLEAVTHPAHLPEIKYSLAAMSLDGEAGYVSADKCLPMYGELEGVDVLVTSTMDAPKQLAISVDRAVARVEVYVKKDAALAFQNMIILGEIRNTTDMDCGFFSPHSLPEVTAGKECIFNLTPTMVEETEAKVLSFYVPEMDCRNQKVKLALSFNAQITTQNPSYAGNWTHIVELGSGASPALDKIERNHVYKLHCCLTKAFQIVCEVDLGLVDDAWDYTVKQAAEVTQDIRITNCYIVRPGGHVDIPLENVYAAWAQMKELGKKPVPPGHQGWKIMWQDVQVVSDAALLNGSGGNDDTNYIRVNTKKCEGNAVVAFTVNEVVYWSWHIWVTDYNPDNPVEQREVNGRMWMDRNLGAMANKYTDDGAARGLLYQWGRKDPFPGAKGWTDGAKTVYSGYDSPNNPTKSSFNYAILDSHNNGGIYQNLPYSIQHPDEYLYVTSDNRDWYSDDPSIKNDTLWNENKKTIFDPCPAGWRVPDWAAFSPSFSYNPSDFLSTHYSFETMGYISQGDGMYIPFICGITRYGDFFSQEKEYMVSFWGTSADRAKASPELPSGIYYDTIMCGWSVDRLHNHAAGSLTGGYKDTAMSVRCVKEE